MTMGQSSGIAPVRQAAILVGGLGSRLGAATARVPEPILPCGGRPFLAWLMRELLRFGIDEFLLLTGHLSPVLEAALPGIAASLPRKVAITVSEGPARAGTGGALHHARDRLHERFLLCNGDSMLDFNLARLLAAAPAPGRIVLRWVADTGRYGVVGVEGDQVRAFQPHAASCGPGLVYAGITLFDRSILPRLRPACSLEADLMPGLAASGGLRATVAEGFFIDTGIPDDLARAQTALPAHLRRPALFLDRDGTINRDHGWVGTRERFEWLDGALAAIAAATEAGWHVFVVTNQSGIARGCYDEPALDSLHGWMIEAVRRAGGTVDDIRYCPFHEDATVLRYRRASQWRKPAPGMILDLIERWELDPARCVLVGDQLTDVAAAGAAGIAGHLFDGLDLLATVAPLLRQGRPATPRAVPAPSARA